MPRGMARRNRSAKDGWRLSGGQAPDAPAGVGQLIEQPVVKPVGRLGPELDCFGADPERAPVRRALGRGLHCGHQMVMAGP